MKPAPALIWLSLALLTAGGASPAPSPDARPVRTVVATRNTGGEAVTLTGHIRARTDENLAFRIDGRMLARRVNVGQELRPGDVSPNSTRNRSGMACGRRRPCLPPRRPRSTKPPTTSSASKTLVGKGWSTRVQYDAAEKTFQTAKASVDAASAQLHTAEDQLGYTQLVADAAGVVTATGAEAGEVVRAGQMIVTVAQHDGVDAVFDVPDSLMRQVTPDAPITVALTDDPKIQTTGHVREASPQADPVTRSFRVKIGLINRPTPCGWARQSPGRRACWRQGGIELPATALTMADNKPAVWVVDPTTHQVSLRAVTVQRQVVQHRRDGRSCGWRAGGDRRRACAAARAESPPRRSSAMTRFNLSGWAITHRPLVYYLMLVLVVIGIASYMRLGRNEDPTFTIKAMVVHTEWPGATLDDTLLQVTERIERKLQETPHLDYLKSYTKAGQSTVFVYLKGSTGPKAVSDAWYQVRKKIKDIQLTLPQGVIGPVADDEFGDTYGIVYGFTADGFTPRELRDYVEDIRSRLLQVPDVAKVNLIGDQPERIYIEFSPAKLAGYGLNASALVAALQAQNAVAPSGVITTDHESIMLRVSGAFKSEKDILGMNFAVGDRIVRLADIAEVRRGDVDPPQPIFRINGKPGLGLAISMRDGGDVLALGHNIQQTMQELKANLPIGIEPVMVANQPDTVSHAIDDFMEALWESIGIVLVVSMVSLGLRAGAIVVVSIPLVLAIVFAAMEALASTFSVSRLARSSSHSACWWTMR